MDCNKGKFNSNSHKVSYMIEVWWDIYLPLHYKFTAKTVGERIVKIGQ